MTHSVSAWHWLREGGFHEVRSPWKQPPRPPTQGSTVRYALARTRPLVSLVRWGFRWPQMLWSMLMFVLVKLAASITPMAGGRFE